MSRPPPRSPPTPPRSRPPPPPSRTTCWSRTCRSTGCAGSTDRGCRLRPGTPVCPAPAGRGPPGAVRGAALPLRHPPAVVPQGPAAAHGGPGAGRRAQCARGLHCRGGGRGRAHPVRPGAGHAGRYGHAGGGVMRLVDQFERGLDAPICLTWELTYACNLACAHCLSSSGRRDPRELTTAQCEAVIDELQRMQVFYVNVGGGEPTIRPDFWHLLGYAV